MSTSRPNKKTAVYKTAPPPPPPKPCPTSGGVIKVQGRTHKVHYSPSASSLRPIPSTEKHTSIPTLKLPFSSRTQGHIHVTYIQAVSIVYIPSHRHTPLSQCHYVPHIPPLPPPSPAHIDPTSISPASRPISRRCARYAGRAAENPPKHTLCAQNSAGKEELMALVNRIRLG